MSLKARDKLGNIVAQRYLSYLYLSLYPCFGMCLTSVGKRKARVFHQMFPSLVGNIFALRVVTFVSAIKDNVYRYGIQGNI
jgi:hypothetical protein